MSAPVLNRVVANFKAEATRNKTIELKALRGQNVVIYFYPKDSTPVLNRVVANFKAEATRNKTIELKELRGQNVVIYFYPKDNTPGCTLEGQDFRDLHARFRRQKTVILGVSRDSLASHEKFRAKQGFPFDLISDPDEKLCRQFDVIREKTLYGRKFMGVVRSTFLIDSAGKLRAEWRNLKVKGHAEDVLQAVKALK